MTKHRDGLVEGSENKEVAMIPMTVRSLAALLLVMISAVAQRPSAGSKHEALQAKISRALAAGPATITKDAKIIDRDE
jgi:hypothetical protein